MSAKRLKTWQKATALVPLALLSGAWTASLAVTTTATAATNRPLPDGSSVPDEAIEAPASVSRPGEIAPGVPAGATGSVISSSSTNGIPSAALAAYQRAAQVINSADPSCNMNWELLAAIGRVESNHGRYGGNILGTDGKSVPGIFGIPLDGSNGTAQISDSDAGQYDDDPVYDRAVGPMQFIPTTWSVVGVDGDGDDVRDPQDIDDAALASAVYLCSGDEDLSTVAGQRTSVYRYNHSQAYVDLVLSIMNAYMNGDYSRVPDGTTAPAVFSPTPAGVAAAKAEKAGSKKGNGATGNKNGGGSNGGGSTGPGAGSESPGGSDPGSPDVPGSPEPGDDPTQDATDPANDKVSALDKAKATCQDNFTAAEIELLGGLTACANAILDGGLGSVQNITDGAGGNDAGGNGDGDVLTEAEATAQCIAQGINPLNLAALQECIDGLLN